MHDLQENDPWADLEPSPPSSTRDPGEEILSRLDDAQRQFARARFVMGATLLNVKEHELWRGRARSFAEYLEDRRINSSAAYQYMRVVQKFFHEIVLTPAQTRAIELVPMRLLDKASKVITPAIADLVIDGLSTLRERDAVVWLNQFQHEKDGKPFSLSADVSRLIGKYRLLADDQRIEFIQRLNFHRHGQTR